jgi:hypothetical protein
MAEWTKARDSKSRIPKGIGGSNPSLSVLIDTVNSTSVARLGFAHRGFPVFIIVKNKKISVKLMLVICR